MAALVSIIYPPGEEAIEAVRECHQAGIRVKMITGDNVEPALSSRNDGIPVLAR